MRRPSSPYASTLSFGPGPLSSALKALMGANVALFLAQSFVAGVTDALGLIPYELFHRVEVWRLATYMFLHAGVWHLLFNMLALWMFGTELERIWGTRYFLKFYFVTVVVAAALTAFFSLLPFAFADMFYISHVYDASVAISVLLLTTAPSYLYLH